MRSDYAFLTCVDENGQAHQEWVSEAFEIITGYTHAEFLALGGWTPLVHLDDRMLDAKSYNKWLENEGVTVEMRIWRKDGALRWVRFYTTPIRDEI